MDLVACDLLPLNGLGSKLESGAVKVPAEVIWSMGTWNPENASVRQRVSRDGLCAQNGTAFVSCRRRDRGRENRALERR